LTDALAKVSHGELQTDCPLVRVDQTGGKPYVMAWRVSSQPGSSKPIVGFVAEPTIITDLFDRILKESPLLPASLGGETGELLTVRVANDRGHPLFASSGIWSPYASENVLEGELGSLRLSVALRPAAAERLIIGGLPRNRVPLLVGLLILTTGLVIVALVQLGRERELVRLRADFISGVSHELRTPLAQIRMFGETLLFDRVRSPQERQRSLSIIVQESQRLTQLIENVLRFSRSERGVALASVQSVRIDELLHEILDTFDPLARAKQASIARRIETGIVAAVDTSALRQIVLNLLDNALKFGPAGQTITVTAGSASSEIYISIDDQGPGVPPADETRIWEPFYRVANHSASIGGTGIGLAIVKQLVVAHRGRVRVERGTSGARFTVELPSAGSSHVSAVSEGPQSVAAGV
jgi:signal transduction histidine kinase